MAESTTIPILDDAEGDTAPAKVEDRARDLAQAKVDRESRRVDGENAAAEYAAKKAALSENIARQKQLRLARDAADRLTNTKAASQSPAKKKKVRRVTAR